MPALNYKKSKDVRKIKEKKKIKNTWFLKKKLYCMR
jgi:hypothetical protein